MQRTLSVSQRAFGKPFVFMSSGRGANDVFAAPASAGVREAGSVLPPGQSGFVSQSGEEDPHFEDQLDDYINWTYKPMPLSMEELEGQTESTETIPVPDSY